MHISWLGQTCVKLQTKYLDEDVTILIDAYKPAKGDFPRNFSPTVALYSAGQANAATLSRDPLVIDTPGEFETKETMILSVPANDTNLIFKIMAEGMNLVHLGRLTKKIDTARLEKIGHIDILFVPVGAGKDYLSLADTSALVTELEPRVVIPIAAQSDSDPGAKTVNDFVKEIGIKPTLTDKKIIIKKKDLPQEETQVMALEKNI